MKARVFSLFIIGILFLSACASSKSNQSSGGGNVPVTGNEVKVTISGFKFDPATVTVKAGDTVTWTNEDTTNHTVTADDNSFGSLNLAKGAVFSHIFSTAGTYQYHCSIHPEMKGTVIVTP